MFRSDINKFDIRLQSRMLEQNKLSTKELEQYNESIEDCQENMELVDISYGDISSLTSEN